MVEASPKFEKKETGLCITRVFVKLDKDNKVSLRVINVLPHKVTIPKKMSNVRFTILTAKQAGDSQPVNPAVLTNYFDDIINSLISDFIIPPYTSSDRCWFPTPENYLNPEKRKGFINAFMKK